MTTEMTVDQIDLTDLDLFLAATSGTRSRRCAARPRSTGTSARGERATRGFWNITKYEDVIKVGVDPYTFVSGKGIILDNDGRRTMRERNLEGAEGAGGFGYMDPRGNMMIMTDPPRHTLLRQIVNKGFTPQDGARDGAATSASAARRSSTTSSSRASATSSWTSRASSRSR